jgi:hypothetical protein
MFQITSTRRPIISFTTPDALDVNKIWNKWLPNYLPEDVFKTLVNDISIRFRMQLLFTLVAPIPRAVENVVIIAQDILKDQIQAI